MGVDEHLILSPDGTCLVTFRSGTTGKFKGAAIPRRRFFIDLQVDYESMTVSIWHAGPCIG